MKFKNRREAGEQLASLLEAYARHPQAVVIALPRGGVVVGAAVAKHLHLPLDIVCPRKIAAPSAPEFALGAVTETGEVFLTTAFTPSLAPIIEREKKEAHARAMRYRKGRPALNLKDKIVLLIDDGLATGATMHAAIKTVKAQNPSSLIVAVPISPPDTFSLIAAEVTHAYALATPTDFFAVGQFYTHFEPTTDEEVISILDSSIT